MGPRVMSIIPQSVGSRIQVLSSDAVSGILTYVDYKYTDYRYSPMIEFNCPHCDRPMRVADQAAGKTGTCKGCGNKVKVPGSASLPVEAPVLVATPQPVHEHPPIINTGPPVAVQVNVPQKSQAAHSLGVGAVILGILAFLICWIPLVNFVSLPMAGIGLLMAVIGVAVALTRRGSGMGYPIAGATICGFAITVALFVNYVVGSTLVAIDEAISEASETNQVPVRTTEESDPPTVIEATDPNQAGTKPSNEWADGFAGVKHGDVVVRVELVETGLVPLKGFGAEGESTKEYLQIKLSIKNVSSTNKIDYITWSGGSLSSFVVAGLTDNLGNSYRRINFVEDVMGQQDMASIYPGKSISDLLVFELPIEHAEFLKLELPAEVIDGTGRLRLKLPLAGR